MPNKRIQRTGRGPAADRQGVRRASMTSRFGRASWSLVVPDGWRAWHDEKCATLVGDDEIGAFQISAAVRNPPASTAKCRWRLRPIDRCEAPAAPATQTPGSGGISPDTGGRACTQLFATPCI